MMFIWLFSPPVYPNSATLQYKAQKQKHSSLARSTITKLKLHVVNLTKVLQQWRGWSPSTCSDVRINRTLVNFNAMTHWAAGSHSVDIRDVSVKKIFHMSLFEFIEFKNEVFKLTWSCCFCGVLFVYLFSTTLNTMFNEKGFLIVTTSSQ